MKRFGLSPWAVGLCAIPRAALADPAGRVPTLEIAGRETFDAFEVPLGIDPGTAILNKIQIAATLHGEKLGLNGWLIHAQIVRFDGQSLSKHLGDIQTADNIEAEPMTRLFEAYLSKMWDKGDHSLALRFGLIDLNSQFDSIDAASLMLNSSHGIGPDLSRSGRNGPSIYPITATGFTTTWVKSNTLAFRTGLFDGTAGSPASPHAFVAERLRSSDGLLAIGQVDWEATMRSRLQGGIWAYTAVQVGPSGRKAHDRGVYVSYEAPLNLLPRLSFWLRGGIANGQAQEVAGYLGVGVVQKGAIFGRPDDRVGLAFAHAIIGDPAADTLGLHHAETTFEATYQVKLSQRIAMQPDLDYIHRPAGLPHAKDSLGIGLRFAYASAYPIRMAASDPGDPTIPPDGAPSLSDDSPDR